MIYLFSTYVFTNEQLHGVSTESLDGLPRCSTCVSNKWGVCCTNFGGMSPCNFRPEVHMIDMEKGAGFSHLLSTKDMLNFPQVGHVLWAVGFKKAKASRLKAPSLNKLPRIGYLDWGLYWHNLKWVTSMQFYFNCIAGNAIFEVDHWLLFVILTSIFGSLCRVLILEFQVCQPCTWNDTPETRIELVCGLTLSTF